MTSRPTKAQYIAAAKRLYHNAGTIEIDDKPGLILTEPRAAGVYVQAWVWVYDTDAVEREVQP